MPTRVRSPDSTRSRSRVRVADCDGRSAAAATTELRASAGRWFRTSRVEFIVPLRSHDHVFLKGHRLMVQVQSTWFPLIDRNPQKFVPSIYAAKAEDFVTATQRVYTSRRAPVAHRPAGSCGKRIVGCECR